MGGRDILDNDFCILFVPEKHSRVHSLGFLGWRVMISGLLHLIVFSVVIKTCNNCYDEDHWISFKCVHIASSYANVDRLGMTFSRTNFGHAHIKVAIIFIISVITTNYFVTTAKRSWWSLACFKYTLLERK